MSLSKSKISLCRRNNGFKDGSDCLLRFRGVERLSSGGDRNVGVHLNSIEVNNRKSDLIRNQSVLLIDDVCTTGNSIKACRKILSDAGASEVKCIVLGNMYST